ADKSAKRLATKESGDDADASVETTTVASGPHRPTMQPSPPPSPSGGRVIRHRKLSGKGDTAANKFQTPGEDQRVQTGDAKVRKMSQEFARNDKTIVVEGYANGAVSGAATRANDRANIVKNQLIDAGVAPARIRIVTHTEAGNAENVRLVAQTPMQPE